MSGESKNDTSLDQAVEELLHSTEPDLDATDPVQDASDPVAEASTAAPIPKGQMDLQVAAVIPMHSIPGVPAKRRPGRPKKVNTQPTPDDLAYHAEMQRQQVAYVDNDAIVRATKARKDTAETLHLCKERLAEVLAALEFRRIEDEKTGGKDSAQILSRQTAVLREIASIELRIRELGVQMIDLRSEPMQKVFSLLIGRVREVAIKVLPKAQLDLFFNRLETSVQGWEEEAEGMLR